LYGEVALGTSLMRIGRDVRGLIMMRFAAHDITLEQWTVMRQIERRKEINQVDLARLSEKDQANVTRILDQLEKKMWVRRMPNPKDRRSYLIAITDEGLGICKKLKPLEADILSSVFDGFSEETIFGFRNQLQQIVQNIVVYKQQYE